MGASHLERRDEDASRNVEKADAKQQPRDKGGIAVGCRSYCLLALRLTLQRLQGGRAVLYVNATFDGTEDSVDFNGALHCPMPVQHRTRAEISHPDDEGTKASVRPPTTISRSLAAVNINDTVSPTHTRIRLQTHIRSASVVPTIGTPTPLSRSSSSSALHSSPSTHMESGTELLSMKEATRLKRIPPVRQLLATLKLGVDP
ncbi:hypothetical protein M422DRAFT_260735 [Sphaerobolus stellatus SS14]|uniref:Uncharacterized protein n=1 Tax=Sphaerobolus stellatus (strain SS14) TaxID=990650 RepID=A0A0C9VH40_SPHS4|nr:hypothetical protein M422DRAFT_260735 [Sphaerobolus stellatus SS14]